MLVHRLLSVGAWLLLLLLVGMGAPARGSTCTRPDVIDIVWLVEGSSSMANLGGDAVYNEYYEMLTLTRFEYARVLIQNFTDTITMSSTTIRQSLVVFSGPNLADPEFETLPVIGNTLLLNNSNAASNSGFQTFVTNDMVLMGGTTNTPEALNFVRTHVLSPQTHRNGAFRYVILITDGAPTDDYGSDSLERVSATVDEVRSLQSEDNAFVILMQNILTGGDNYPSEWNSTVFDHIYQFEDFILLPDLADDFLCNLGDTLRPTASPTTSVPTTSPTTSVPTASPVQCFPGNVTCCVSPVFLSTLTAISRSRVLKSNQHC